MRMLSLAVGLLALVVAPADAQVRREAERTAKPASPKVRREPPPPGFRRVSDLVNLPRFMPGIGILYVKPDTLPTGPFLAYDRAGRRVSTIYMLSLEEMQNQKTFELAGRSGTNDHVSVYFNAGHAGVEMPHYHVVVWHVPKRAEARVAR
jgi:hypothetical protein